MHASEQFETFKGGRISNTKTAIRRDRARRLQRKDSIAAVPSVALGREGQRGLHSAKYWPASDFNTANVRSAIPRTLDELWDLLNERQQIHDVYSTDDAIFESEQDESSFWTRFDSEGADDSEPQPP